METFTFKGRLCGTLCPDHPEPLSNVRLRLYRLRDTQDAAARAVASPKETLALLSDEDVKAKEPSLLAEVETDAEGRFSFELGERQGYRGEAFDVDIYCGTVPRLKPKRVPPRPRQLSITTFQPQWRRREEGRIAVWEYCLPQRVWCWFRGLFGAWTICGKVVTCDQPAAPVANVKVSAFDVDWLQDDPLGSALTDAGGRFRIDYSTDDFETTPFSPGLDLELTGGPDVYFRVETAGGVSLLDEPPSRGRKPDRENRGPCFCTSLCVDLDPAPPFENPWFTHVGDFHILGDINAATGLTHSAVLGHSGPGYGFFGALKLRGFCPKTISGQPARYRFLYENLATPGTLTPITGSLVTGVLVGARLILWDTFGTGLAWTFQSIYVKGSGATTDPTPAPVLPPGTPWGAPPAHVIIPDDDGWIAVDPNGLDGGFYGPLLRFDTTGVLPTWHAPGNGAGNAPPSPKNGIDLAIHFEAGPVTGPAVFSNTLGRIHVNNWNSVVELNLQELSGPGTACSKITNAIHIQHTVDHELTAAWSLGISSAAAFPPPPPLPSGTGPRGGFGTHFVDVSLWPPCAYFVTLGTHRRLTDGEDDDEGTSLQVVFCK
ncbi:MAG TPA: hypothetical protein DD490_29865 [Acidobacteria bacterium]|nr:hypothetical protein [Acidobacteriota bacterium]